VDLDLLVPAGVVVVGVGTWMAAIAAIKAYGCPKPAPVLTLAWVHEGLREPEPIDPALLEVPAYWWGAPTRAWPMVWELGDEPDVSARQRFEASVAELDVPVIVPVEWARHTFDDPSGVRLLVAIGGAA
jgi:hypothetical protein